MEQPFVSQHFMIKSGISIVLLLFKRSKATDIQIQKYYKHTLTKDATQENRQGNKTTHEHLGEAHKMLTQRKKADSAALCFERCREKRRPLPSARFRPVATTPPRRAYWTPQWSRSHSGRNLGVPGGLNPISPIPLPLHHMKASTPPKH